MKIKEVWHTFDKRSVQFWMDGYDTEQFGGHAACLVEIDGKPLLMRNGDHALWFRFAYLNKTEFTYFFFDSADQNAFKFDEAWLENQYRTKQFGRVVPVPVTSAPDCQDFELLYFRSDGTGYIWPGPSQEEFSWISIWKESLDPINETFEMMSFLSRLIFDDLNAKLVNPRIDRAALKDQPFEFINGSQEELKRVTGLICYSGIGKPDSKPQWEITYYAPHIERNRAGGVSEWSFHKSPKLRELFNLAYEYNAFTGYHWEHNDDAYGYKNSYNPEPIEIYFTFPLATKEEQNEAKLELMRWLDGKLQPEEIQELFGSADAT